MNEFNKRWTAIGLVVGVFLAAMEGSIVATAMPEVIKDLGGEHLYALPFSMYLLTTTISSPIWGKLSDIFGRKIIYVSGVILFLLGSAGSGASQSMEMLIWMRILQGLGAGCITPLTFIINADMFTVVRRARIQGYMSAVWGFSGLVGPLLGGFIVDWVSWRYIFYLNIPFGICALIMVMTFYKEQITKSGFKLDWIGTLLFTASASLLVYGLEVINAWMIISGIVGLIFSWIIDSRHPHPLLPIQSLKMKIPRSAMNLNFLAGMAYFGILAFLPLYVQRVESMGATTAGLVLTPMIVGWTITNIIGGRILSRVSLFFLTRLGFSILVIGFVGLVLFYNSSIYHLATCGFFVGSGMGFSMLGTLLTAQEFSPRSELGSSTSSVMFARTIGGSVGVSILSAIIAQNLDSSLTIIQNSFWWGYLTCAAFAICAFIISITLSEKPLPEQETNPTSS